MQNKVERVARQHLQSGVDAEISFLGTDITGVVSDGVTAEELGELLKMRGAVVVLGPDDASQTPALIRNSDAVLDRAIFDFLSSSNFAESAEHRCETEELLGRVLEARDRRLDRITNRRFLVVDEFCKGVVEVTATSFEDAARQTVASIEDRARCLSDELVWADSDDELVGSMKVVDRGTHDGWGPGCTFQGQNPEHQIIATIIER